MMMIMIMKMMMMMFADQQNKNINIIRLWMSRANAQSTYIQNLTGKTQLSIFLISPVYLQMGKAWYGYCDAEFHRPCLNIP